MWCDIMSWVTRGRLHVPCKNRGHTMHKLAAPSNLGTPCEIVWQNTVVGMHLPSHDTRWCCCRLQNTSTYGQSKLSSEGRACGGGSVGSTAAVAMVVFYQGGCRTRFKRYDYTTSVWLGRGFGTRQKYTQKNLLLERVLEKKTSCNTRPTQRPSTLEPAHETVPFARHVVTLHAVPNRRVCQSPPRALGKSCHWMVVAQPRPAPLQQWCWCWW